MAENDVYAMIRKSIGVNEEEASAQFARQRMIPMYGKITDDTARELGATLISLDARSNEPITLLISSGGGDTQAADSLRDTISCLNSPVDGLVISHAGSMAIDVLLGCRRRYSLPNSTFFLHFTRCGFDAVGESDQIDDEDLEAMKKKLAGTVSRREKLYCEHLNIDVAAVRRLFRRGERFRIDYSAEEALELHLIDEIRTGFKFLPTVQKTC